MRSILFALVLLTGCDPGPRVVTDSLDGVRYSLRLPADFTRAEIPTTSAHLYVDPSGAGVTVTFASPLPADLEGLYRQTGARKFDGTLLLEQWHRLEATTDGFVGEMTTADGTTTKVFVMRREGPHQLVCNGEAGHRHTPVAATARPVLAAICDSFHVVP